MKTLGQIAYEGFSGKEIRPPVVLTEAAAMWEAAAQAVRAAVLEEAAQFFDDRAAEEKHRNLVERAHWGLAATWLRHDIKDQQ